MHGLTTYKKTIIFLLIILVAALALISFLFFNKKRGLENAPAERLAPAENRLDLLKKENEIFAGALSANNYSNCLEIKKEDAADSCLLAFASEKEDNEACSFIGNEEIKKECLDLLVMFAAKKSNNIDSCRNIKLENYRQSCVIDIAAAKNFSREDCAKLEADIQPICLNHILFSEALKNSSPETCLLVTSDKEECLYTVFRDSKNLSGCGSYSAEVKKYCEENKTANTAGNTGEAKN